LTNLLSIQPKSVSGCQDGGLKLVLYFFASLLFHHVTAQPVTLKLHDKVSGSPVEYAYVIITPLHGTVQEKHMSDNLGEVSVKTALPAVVFVSCIGYHDLNDTLFAGDSAALVLSPDFYQLDQVVVTGQFRPQPVDKSIYKIDIIDSREIRLKGANTMGDLLKTELSFQYRTEGVLGDFIRIRGLSGEYVKILIDGMPVTGRVADRIDLGQLTLNNVDHIEIVEGPMSVVYGSNALAGAINIITADYSGRKLGFNADAYYETVGTYNLNAAMSIRTGSHTFSLNGSRNFFYGWGPEDTSRYKIWKPKLQYMAGAGYQFRKGKYKATINSDFLSEELHDPGALTQLTLYEKAVDGYHYTTRWNNRINVINTFNDDFVFNLQAGYSYYQKRKLTYLNDLVNLEKTLAEDPDLHDTTTFHMISARGFVSNIPGKKYEYQTGFDVNHESAHGKRTGGDRQITDMAGFINLVYKPVTTFSIQPGLRVMHNSDFKAPLIYNLSLKYNPASFIFRASYGKGFRAPSLKELYLVFIDNNHEIHGNENLQSETADNLGFSFNYDLNHKRNALNFKLDLFYNSIHNAIQLAINVNKPGWGKYFNVEGMNYKTKGMEARVLYRFSPTVTANFGVIATGRIRLDSGSDFAWSTDYVSSVNYLFEKPAIQMALFYKYTDDYLDFAGNFNEEDELIGIAQQSMEGYHTLDFTVSRNFFGETLGLVTGFKNLFNVTLVNSTGSISIHGNSSADSAVAGYGRTFFVKLAYRFEKK
jgi:outer membrane receptor for ferrienterochelin and colicins